MNGQRWYGLWRLGWGLAVLAAVATQFRGAFDDPYKSTVMFWSEFTYQSNLVVGIVLLAGAWFLWNGTEPGRWWDLTRGAMVAYTAMTFVVYRFLVEGTSNTPGGGHYYESWASDVLHKVIPVVILLDWLARPPATRLTWRDALLWPVYPIVFCAYSLVRGPLVDWYPYSFLDHAKDGWGMVALWVAAITFGFVLFSMVVVWLGNRARGWWSRGGYQLPMRAAGA